MAPQDETMSWTHHDQDGKTYVCSTDPSFLQLDALNEALGSDMLWWAMALPEDRLKTMVENCMVLGLYLIETETSSQQPQESLKRTMIGSARLITDRVTFGYVTDVYVLKEHQQRGLGTFLMKCLNVIVEGWPELRAVWILPGSPELRKLYGSVFGARDFLESNNSSKLRLLEKMGPASKH
ncbi:hypothetical protein VM1G_05002 [Cytospora mali]|uniref:N-acetyltransferase domain-containing protein n=1 Tax=Cytospora mali TaxID=578113 RepID=A0A194VZT1_CYTMA|nr:hypothetical protein VM1G_05002 [Valsa mali]